MINDVTGQIDGRLDALVKAMGLQTVYDQNYPPNLVDFSSIIRAVRAAKPYLNATMAETVKSVLMPDPPPMEVAGQRLALSICYEDDYVRVDGEWLFRPY